MPALIIVFYIHLEFNFKTISRHKITAIKHVYALLKVSFNKQSNPTSVVVIRNPWTGLVQYGCIYFCANQALNNL